jgi:hypothetical protein
MAERVSAQEIDLTPAEQNSLAELTLNISELRDGGDHAQSNGERAYKLIHLLLSRKAMPDARIKFFVDPEFDIGGRDFS